MRRTRLSAIALLPALLLAASRTEATDAPAFASHVPPRPLPAPAARPRRGGQGRLVDTTRGDDRAAGTEASPGKTLTHAVEQLQPGETLYVRGGIYFERPRITRSGTPDRPITIRGFPGELAVINGGIRAFYEQPQQAWEPCPNGVAGEFCSRETYPDLGGSRSGVNVLGRFGDSFVPLMGYRFLNDLRDPSMVWDVTEKVGDSEGVYCGPGIFYDVDSGRIHARLAHTNLRALGDDNYRGETDPRKLPLIIAGVNAGPALAIQDARHVRLQDLVVCGSSTGTMQISGCGDVICDGLTVYGGRSAIQVSGTAGLRLHHTACRGIAAPWTFRGHLKYRSIEARIFTASGWTPRASENRDFELAYCEFTDCVDGVFIGNVKNVHFHHNLLDNVSDDGMFLTAGTARDGTTFGGEHYIYQNLISRCLTSLAFGGGHGRQQMTPSGRQTGEGAWVYRNVFDLRRPVHYQLPAPDDSQVTSHGRVASDHGGPAWEPIRFYHNTIVEHTPLDRDYYLADLAGHMSGGVRRRLFNNIAVQVEGAPGAKLPTIVLPPEEVAAAAKLEEPAVERVDPLESLIDGALEGKPRASTIRSNLDPKELQKLEETIGRKPAAPLPFDLQADGNLHWSLRKPPAADMLAAFRDSREFQLSQRWYNRGGRDTTSLPIPSSSSSTQIGAIPCAWSLVRRVRPGMRAWSFPAIGPTCYVCWTLGRRIWVPWRWG